MNFSELQLELKDKLTPEEGFAFNKELVARHKQQYLDSQQYNKGKLILSPIKYSSTEEIIFRDFNSPLI